MITWPRLRDSQTVVRPRSTLGSNLRPRLLLDCASPNGLRPPLTLHSRWLLAWPRLHVCRIAMGRASSPGLNLRLRPLPDHAGPNELIPAHPYDTSQESSLTPRPLLNSVGPNAFIPPHYTIDD